MSKRSQSSLEREIFLRIQFDYQYKLNLVKQSIDTT
jgi:hypothetical protein